MSAAPASGVRIPETAPLLESVAFRRLLTVQLLFGMGYSIFLILPKYLARNLGADAGGIGFVMAAFGVGNIAVSPFLGAIVRRFGRRGAIVLAHGLLVASALGFLAVRSAGPLAASLRAVQGAAWGTLFAAGTHLCATLAPQGRLVQAIAFHSSAILVTNAFGPAVAEALLGLGGPGAAFGLAAMLAVGGGFRARGLPEPPLREPAPENPAAEAAGAGRRRYLVLVGLVHGVAVSTMFSFYQPLALERGAVTVSGFLVAYTVTAVLARVVGSRVTGRLGVPRTVFLANLAYGLVVAGTAALTSSTMLVFGGLFGIVQGFFYPSFVGHSLERSGSWGHGRMLGRLNIAFNAGTVALVPLGLASREVGYPALFLAAGAATVVVSMGLAPGRESLKGEARVSR